MGIQTCVDIKSCHRLELVSSFDKVRVIEELAVIDRDCCPLLDPILTSYKTGSLPSPLIRLMNNRESDPADSLHMFKHLERVNEDAATYDGRTCVGLFCLWD